MSQDIIKKSTCVHKLWVRPSYNI